MKEKLTFAVRRLNVMLKVSIDFLNTKQLIKYKDKIPKEPTTEKRQGTTPGANL